MQRAAGVWAGRAVAPAFRKLSACGEARRMLRHALAGWAQREMANAWRTWDGAAAARAAAAAQARPNPYPNPYPNPNPSPNSTP